MVSPAQNPPETWTTKRARVAGLARRNASPERIDAARAELKTAVLIQRIREAVATWPPLSEATRAELAILLLSAGDDHAAST